VIAYDGDNPGQDAIMSAIKAISTHTKLAIQTVIVPEKLDPDEYLRKYGAEAFYQLAMHGRSSVFEFKANYLKRDKNLANESEKITYVNELLNELVEVTSVLEQDVYLNKIVEQFPDITIESLRLQLEQLKMDVRSTRPAPPQNAPIDDFYGDYVPYDDNAVNYGAPIEQRRQLTTAEIAERMLFYRILTDESVRMRIENQGDFQFYTDICQKLYKEYQTFRETAKTGSEQEFLSFLQNEDERNELTEIMMKTIECEDVNEEVADLQRTISKAVIERSISEKQTNQLAAMRIGNTDAALDLAMEIISLKQQLAHV
jgi:DNA primase